MMPSNGQLDYFSSIVGMDYQSQFLIAMICEVIDAGMSYCINICIIRQLSGIVTGDTISFLARSSPEVLLTSRNKLCMDSKLYTFFQYFMGAKCMSQESAVSPRIFLSYVAS